jgi:hypothetical protein
VYLFALAAGVLPAQAAAQAPSAKPATKPATPAVVRGPDGKPDLQGFWDFRTLTPLERPANQANKAVLTEEEANSLTKQNTDRRARAAETTATRTEPRKAGGGGAAVGAYNDFWFDGGASVVNDRRTSLIVDPPDGRLPARQKGAFYQAATLTGDAPAGPGPVRLMSTGAGTDGPENRGLAERCLVGFNSGPPMLPSYYNNHMQLVQTRDYVVILNEMNHDARIIPIGPRPLIPGGVRQWAGVSHGYWEGDTLVIKTTNFTDKTPSFSPNLAAAAGTGATLNLTERFRRADANTLIYEFTVDDPATFTRPFTAVVPMQKSEEPVYEYACHEGNYGLLNVLRGARLEAQEQVTR